MQNAIVTLLGENKIKITAVGLGKKAIEKIKKNKFDCIVLDLSLPDITGFEVLKELEKLNVTIPPVIIYTGKDITKEEEFELNKYTSSIIIKGVKSDERLLDETALFLHQVVDEMPENKQKIISRIYDQDALFEGKKVLVVDDDMRNVFAVSHILEEKGMEIFSAANGKKALEVLEKEKPFDMVLMDIMMPVMDGYETMKNIRKQTKYRDLTIIALTAKAMKGDKEQCLAVGANDYLAKPLQIDKLLSLMRVWMYK
jgi:CheY-like chemotaxis protein